jgi:hypothetical protein
VTMEITNEWPNLKMVRGNNMLVDEVHIRHQCRKTTVLSRHRCLINTGVEKMNNI